MKNPAKPRVRLAAAAAAMAVLAFGVAGCGAINQQSTAIPVDVSDGVSAGDAATLRADNLLMVTNGDKAPVRLIGNVSNNTGKASDFKATFNGRTANVLVPAHDYVNLADSRFAKRFTFEGTADGEGATTNPGLQVSVKVTLAGDEHTVVVPVVDGTLPDYAPYVPGGSNPDVRDHLEPSAAGNDGF